VPLIIDKIEVNLDFHIFDILDFDLLLGSPFEKLLVHQGSLDEMLRKAASATTTSCLENPMAKHLPKPNLLMEMVYESPFVSSEPLLFDMVGTAISKEYDSNETLHFCEDERSSSPLSMFEPLPSGPEYIVLDPDRHTNMTLHDASLEMENQWAIEFYEAPTLEYKEKDSLDEHGSFILEIPQEPCSFNASPESVTLCAPSIHEEYNCLKVLSCKTFRRPVVDAYVYRKHCRFRGCTATLTLQQKLLDTSTIGGETMTHHQ